VSKSVVPCFMYLAWVELNPPPPERGVGTECGSSFQWSVAE